MTMPKKSVIYETLNQKRNTTTDGTQLDMFAQNEAVTPRTRAEYWLYSDLHNLFGEFYFPISPTIYQNTYQNLRMPSGKKQTPDLVTPTQDFYNGHVAAIQQPYSIAHKPKGMYTDYELTRYACWCMTHKNPNMIFARTYFISPVITPDMPLDEMKKLSYQFARTNLREQLKEYEKQIAGILNRTNGHFSLFNHNMTRAFFYGYNAHDLKHIYRIPEKDNDPLSNYMGAGALYARICALRDAIAEFNNSKSTNVNVFDEILHKHLTNNRVKLIHDTGIRPEQDIFQTPVSQVATQLKNTERDFIKQYSKIKLR